MAHKDFPLILSPKTSFVQIKSKIGQGKIKIKNYASQKLMQEIRCLGKILWASNSFEICAISRDILTTTETYETVSLFFSGTSYF
jgi:hypothetical protein